jgi:hypothetical protein
MQTIARMTNSTTQNFHTRDDYAGYTMNAPDKLIKIPMAQGVYLLRAAPAKAHISRQRTAMSLLSAMRREKHPRSGKAGRTYLKELRTARHAR